ncbi:tetratricopeptide repeat protein [Phenylobacterium montanum]|uniref:Tetratricopeptide repeat protein n=1 Tax=Phenylobacterium montanum TaxID=2823693 RepID=A0A975ITU5_9CAUL|nr:tetratricopeptide repeat protein [Caulobacter sp. S6]QUD87123.1 tetratricopeptide repeat protein [Caulobacter sp. S6]
MRLLVFGAAFALLSGAAHAADKPVIGPPAPWVQPASSSKALAAAADQAAFHVLLLDQQVHFGDEGVSTYAETRTRVQTAQGLDALGTTVLPWNPDTDTLTVHRLDILRGGQVINVLAKQNFTIVRRENNLERAMLDGVLTAVIQPEGLQVGDVVDLAYTLTRKDPAVQGRGEHLIGALPDTPIDRVRMRAVWSQARPVRWLVGDGFDQPAPKPSGGAVELLLDKANLQPLHPPTGAPGRFAYPRSMQLSQFSSWADLSSIMQPLYAKAARLGPDSPVAGEAAKIRAATTDPKARAAAALALVQNQIRYVFLGMNDGGLVPAGADQTWSRRFGDCKAKTALLIALLNQLDVPAEPVVVSSTGGDGMDGRIPAIGYFDHVLVRATIAGRAYWLDGTRTGDTSLDTLKTPAFGWGLPIRAADAALIRMTPEPLDKPQEERSLRLDATAGIDKPAPAHAEAVFRGDEGLLIKLKLDNVTATDLDRALKHYWTENYDFIEPSKVSAQFDARTGEERLTLDGTAKMNWEDLSGTSERRYEAESTRLGWKADFKRDPGPHADAPFAVPYPAYAEARETVLLPNNGAGFTFSGEQVDKTVAGRALRRTISIDKGVFTVVASMRSVAQEFPASEAPAATTILTDMSKKTVYLNSPSLFSQPADKAKPAPEAKTTADFMDRGRARATKGQIADALADFERAIALDPQNAAAYSARGLIHLQQRRLDMAQQDFDKAFSIDPNDFNATRGRAVIAAEQHRYAEALTGLDKVLALAPSDAYILNVRAGVYSATGRFEDALTDAAAAMQGDPDNLQIAAFRINLLAMMGDPRAVDEADQALARHPGNTGLLYEKAHALARLGRRADAQKVYDAIIAAKPSVVAYLARARNRDPADLDGQVADADAALKLDPTADEAQLIRAAALLQKGDRAGGQAAMAKVRIGPRDVRLKLARATAYARSGQTALANQDFYDLRTGADKNATLLNDLCWRQAVLGINLDSARADCESALKLSPDYAEAVDSYAFVLLRQGRVDDALAQYQAAVKLRPKLAASLYGRGLAELRKGLTAEGHADLTAARAASPTIEAEFASYGMKP